MHIFKTLTTVAMAVFIGLLPVRDWGLGLDQLQLETPANASDHYRTSGQPDAAKVRSVINGLGTGKHITVKTTGSKKYRGYIQSIEPEHFTIVPDADTRPVRIGYSECGGDKAS